MGLNLTTKSKLFFEGLLRIAATSLDASGNIHNQGL